MGVVPDIVDLIHRSMRSLRDLERKVAKVVLTDLQFAMTASATEIAARANVSTVSVTRFCRALGFENMREFKLCVAQNLAISAHFMLNSVARSDSLGELVRSVTDGFAAAIVDTAQDNDIDGLSASLGIISAARRVHVFHWTSNRPGTLSISSTSSCALARPAPVMRCPTNSAWS